MARQAQHVLWIALGAATACGTSASPNESTDLGALPEPTLRSDVQAITRAEDAEPGVVIPPFIDCRDPKAGETGSAANGQVCTPVSIAGCTEPGKYFPDYASCDVVRTQRPYSPAPPANTPKKDDPRLSDPAFMTEYAWVTEQARAAACTCCHDSKQAPRGPSQWAIDAEPLWTDTVSDNGIALFTGLANSAMLGAYAPEQNHGFERAFTGIPSTDGTRMRAFFVKELARRGITPEQAAAVPPFGGSLFENLQSPPTDCTNGEGVDAQGRMHWRQAARYVYILEKGSINPGVPPNLDLPQGTVFRLDVLASKDPIAPGIRYGETPAGSFQAYPVTGRAPALTSGKQYVIFTELDVALVGTKCIFTYPAAQ